MKRIGAGMVVALFGFVALLACEKATAAEGVSNHEYAMHDLSGAKTAAKCFVLGQVMGMPDDELSIFIARIGQHNEHPCYLLCRGI